LPKKNFFKENHVFEGTRAKTTLGNNHVPEGKINLNCSLGNNHVLKGARLKLPQGITMFLREKKILPWDMIVPPWKKRLKLFFEITQTPSPCG
jgi:hypothetical protein